MEEPSKVYKEKVHYHRKKDKRNQSQVNQLQIRIF